MYSPVRRPQSPIAVAHISVETPRRVAVADDRGEGHTRFATWLDLNAQGSIVPGLRAIVSLENVTNVQYEVNLAGSGANELNSYGLLRTLRVGIEAFRN
jgi:hypothetical protein